MTRLLTILSTLLFSVGAYSSRGQEKLTSELSLLFGHLPMNLPATKVIALAESDKHFAGRTQYNLDLSYSGVTTVTEFFKLKPDTCFVEIVSNAAELFPDSMLVNTTCFNFEAGYSSAGSFEVGEEFERIVKLFTDGIFFEKIEEENGTFHFFESKVARQPTLTLYVGQRQDCYSGKRCIKFTYFRLPGK